GHTRGHAPMAATPDALRRSSGCALPRPSRSAALAAALLAVVLAAGAIQRLDAANDPVHATPSADQRAYVRVAHDLRALGTFGDSGLAHPFHWAPGAPALFAAADAIAGTPAGEPLDLRAARRAQAVVGTLTVLAVFALAALLAGRWAGVAAAAAASPRAARRRCSPARSSSPVHGAGTRARSAGTSCR